MLELLPSAEHVVAMRVTGRLDEADVERAIAAIEAALAKQQRIALLAEVDATSFTAGAFARDLSYTLGKLGELRRFPKVAVVTSQGWIRTFAQIEDRIFPQIKVRTFAPAERDEALAWVSGPLDEPAFEPIQSGPSMRLIETDQPDVLGFEINGRIRRSDMESLIPSFEQALSKRERVRVLALIRSFDGLTLDALGAEGLAKLKLKALKQVERYALVGGPDWMETILRQVGSWLPMQTRHFDLSEEAAAWEWLKADEGGKPITTEFLDAFAAAWNRHDTDAILSMMTPDCIFQTSLGSQAHGTRHVGQDEVRRGIDEVFRTFPDARWNDPKHFIAGDRGVTQWTFTGSGPNGRVEVEGCDLFTFRDGKIAVKDSFRKQRVG
jgi:hypothetical protein